MDSLALGTCLTSAIQRQNLKILSSLQRPTQLLFTGIRLVYKKTPIYSESALVLGDKLVKLTALWTPSDRTFLEQYRSGYYQYYHLQ